ncbi:MAG TPA: hypothetical protein VGY58_14325, partial [Gemmataceae bacterium]|nr:hypothetical protein [Gemmataceae bacterium]
MVLPVQQFLKAFAQSAPAAGPQYFGAWAESEASASTETTTMDERASPTAGARWWPAALAAAAVWGVCLLRYGLAHPAMAAMAAAGAAYALILATCAWLL